MVVITYCPNALSRNIYKILLIREISGFYLMKTPRGVSPQQVFRMRVALLSLAEITTMFTRHLSFLHLKEPACPVISNGACLNK